VAATTPLKPASAASLARIIRAIFPHDRLGDGPYLRSAEQILGGAATHAQSVLVAEGVRGLEDAAGRALTDVDVDELTRLVQGIHPTEFFQLVLTSSVVSLYSDDETWEFLGYEGPSFDLGGYVHRGFDDLDWLPEPRITEYEGEPLIEYVPSDAKTGAVA